MWLITSLIAAVVVTLLWRFKGQTSLKLDILAVMLWGLTVMIFVDHMMGYEGGSFLEAETDGFVPNSTLLGILMLIPVVIVWAIYIMIANRKRTVVKE